MQTISFSDRVATRHFPPFNLETLLKTIFQPKNAEKICILIDLPDISEVINFNFLKNPKYRVQKKAYEVFYQGLEKGVLKKLGMKECGFFAYQETGGSNLELPQTAMAPNGKIINLQNDVYRIYDIILCITTFSATAPLTALAKKFNFRGATMHGVNDIILQTGLAVDYKQVSREAEQLRCGMNYAEAVEIDFEYNKEFYHLHIDLAGQCAQKSHGICIEPPDIVNLPAGEVYFVPAGAEGSFPMKLEDGTVVLMKVHGCQVQSVTLLAGNNNSAKELQMKFKSDPASSFLGELGFGTQVLPFSGADIQDEKIFGTFHLATGRNDHLNGSITLNRFINPRNATHDDILFSPNKTPEIHIKQVLMSREGKVEKLIENYDPCTYLWNLLEAQKR